MPKDSHGYLVPGRIGPPRSVPESIPRPEYVGRAEPAPSSGGGDFYSPEEIGAIRRAGRVAAGSIERVGRTLVAGMTTDDIDAIVHRHLIEHRAYPSTLGYRGFSKSCCTSVNEVICHGIPDDTLLESGDIVNIDVTAFLDGYHGDTNQTFIVEHDASAPAETPTVAQELVERTREATARGIRAVAPGRHVNVIGRAIESYARRFGYGVVRDYTGHGVGRAFHSGLIIPHYDAPQFDTVMQPGMVFTIEPMLTLGDPAWDLWPDDWTVVTRDRSLTAQFEHTLVVTERGADILTLP